VGLNLFCTPSSSITKTCRHNIAEILLKVALNTINQSTIFRLYSSNCLIFSFVFFILWYKLCGILIMYKISKYFQNILDLSTIDVPKHLWKLLKEFRKTSHVTWYSTDEWVVRHQNMKLEILWLLYNKQKTQQEHLLSELNYKTRLKVHMIIFWFIDTVLQTFYL
jgi:hypothetical protein